VSPARQESSSFEFPLPPFKFRYVSGLQKWLEVEGIDVVERSVATVAAADNEHLVLD
jgi:hypothetical protein